LTQLSSSPPNYQCQTPLQKSFASIPALELSNALQYPAPVAPFSYIGTAQLQALRQLSDIFSSALPSGTAHHAPPFTQNSSQFRGTDRHGFTTHTRIPRKPIPATPMLSPPLAPYRYQRVIPSQVPSTRVALRINPNDVASLRVITALRLADVIQLTLHPASDNAPCMPQGMAGMNLFDTFEEEHMETPAVPRYNTRSRARQNYSNKAHTLNRRIFRPIAFTNNQAITLPFKQAPKTMPMANSVINENTGSSLEYRHLIQDESTFPVWNNSAANEFGRLAQGVGGRIEGSNTFVSSNVRQYPKER
jgi:hypothetical protein